MIIKMNISFLGIISSYLRGVPLGEEITIDAKASKIGKTLSFLTVDLLDSRGRLLAQGKHTKFVGTVGKE